MSKMKDDELDKVKNILTRSETPDPYILIIPDEWLELKAQALLKWRDDWFTKKLKKVSFKKGDMIVAHTDLTDQLREITLPIDFKLPIIITDNLSKLKSSEVE